MGGCRQCGGGFGARSQRAAPPIRIAYKNGKRVVVDAAVPPAIAKASPPKQSPPARRQGPTGGVDSTPFLATLEVITLPNGKRVLR